ncbi:uncharacterized protein [Pyxicephalus adspersus]|uniref:uncharacterized protein isoform X2 n=1 Tax=Pyxicephalus adspersus TaxID=30357 RepID=UPI003B5BF8FE
MAESWASGNLRNVELQSFTSSRGCQGHYVKGKLLSVADIYDILDRNESQVNASGMKMLETIEKMEPHDFQLIQQEFPVSYLQHVTDQASMERIYNQEGFRIFKKTSRPGFSDLSFWSADIASEDIEAAREMSYDNVKKVLPSWTAEYFEENIKEQFANSPAFDASASRYGNFKFSFPLFSLLDLYQAQHCRGEEPQLRILGTDMYKQEIAHYILVHSPDESKKFKNLPMVPTVWGNPTSNLFVYRKRGILYWRPESTSSVLTVKVSEKGKARRECPIPCDFYIDEGYCSHIKEENYRLWSVWNHLIFAFHLPNHCGLEIKKEQLLKNLTACRIDDSPLLEVNKQLKKKEAKSIILKMKNDFRRLRRNSEISRRT